MPSLSSLTSSIWVWLFGLYILFAILFFILSDYVLFQPPRPVTYPNAAPVFQIPFKTGSISAIYLPNKEAKFTILFSHGNAEDLGTVVGFIQYLHQQGFAVLAYDYQGYGNSTGKASEKNTYQDITAAYQYLVNTLKIPADDIIVFGRSLGTGPSIYLASLYPCAALILESPFVSAYRVQTFIPLFPFDKYRNLVKMDHIQVPVLVIHGMQDEVIAPWHGRRIFEAVKGPKQIYLVKGAHHNNVVAVNPVLYGQTIKQFMKDTELLNKRNKNNSG